jgi:hypothetical protein
MNNIQERSFESDIRSITIITENSDDSFFEIQIQSILSQLKSNDFLIIRVNKQRYTNTKIEKWCQRFPEKILCASEANSENLTENILSLIFFALTYKPEYFFIVKKNEYWLPEKLESSINILENRKGPVLLISSVFISDKNLNITDEKLPAVSLSLIHAIFEPPHHNLNLGFNCEFANVFFNWNPLRLNHLLYNNIITLFAKQHTEIILNNRSQVIFVKQNKSFSYICKWITKIQFLNALVDQKIITCFEILKIKKNKIIFFRIRQSYVEDILTKILILFR